MVLGDIVLFYDIYVCVWILFTGTGYHYKGMYVESATRKLRDGYQATARNSSEPVMLTTMIGHFMHKVNNDSECT